MAPEDSDSEGPEKKTETRPSTLIEFPGAGRASRPLWRKELSERVREIQERRLREGAQETHDEQLQSTTECLDQPVGTSLGLVPQLDQPELNPLVVAALKRIERAQQPQTQPHTRSSMRGGSVAVARVAEVEFEVGCEVITGPALIAVQEAKREITPPEKKPEAQRAHGLTVVQPQLAAGVTVKGVTANTTQTVFPPIPAVPFATQVTATLAPGDVYDDYASMLSRFVAGVIDLFVVAFAASPFAAIIELTNGDWTDERVLASMVGIVTIVMFLYLTTSITLGGRTWGMSLLTLRTVDVDTGLPPTPKQSVIRSFAYMLSLVTLGLGILYALVDAEGRGLHDHLSGTTVVRE